jgi:hypothetical protein
MVSAGSWLGWFGQLLRDTLLKSSSVFIISIKDSHKQTQDVGLEADLYLLRPFLISELWKALEYPVKH